MSQKARLFGDDETAGRILLGKSPKEVQQLGREAKDFDAAIWDDKKLAVVQERSSHKFEQNPELRDYLISTKDLILVEASPVDRIWGIELVADDADASNPLRWRGENLLGFALMHVRERLFP